MSILFVPLLQRQDFLNIALNGRACLNGPEFTDLVNSGGRLIGKRIRIDKKLDTDNPAHIQWIFESALARAKEYNITGVTLQFTQGVLKNIIPAVASTNAMIAAACVNEAVKISTNIAPYLNNYMMYMGDEGAYTHTFELERKADCPVCQHNPVIDVTLNPNWSLDDLIFWTENKPSLYPLIFQ